MNFVIYCITRIMYFSLYGFIVFCIYFHVLYAHVCVVLMVFDVGKITGLSKEMYPYDTALIIA